MDIPFEQRLGLKAEKLISNDFPDSAQVALIYLLEDLVNRNYIIGSDNATSWNNLLNGMYRSARIIQSSDNWPSYQEELKWLLSSTEWSKIFNSCERVYSRLLVEVSDLKDQRIIATKQEVEKYFTEEMNILLFEENFDYKFKNGQFERAGRLQTQKSIKRMGAVLSSSSLSIVRQHYIKAVKFFNNIEDPDYKNSIKESLCALELCIELTTGKPASKNFTRSIKELEGNGKLQIPPQIAESIIKVFAYRGGGQGVAHAAPNGSKTTKLEAELILNITAAYITYIVDLFPENIEEVPF